MGFRIKIGGLEIKGDTPDETLKKAVQRAQQTSVLALTALNSGNLEDYKRLVGNLVLDNNLATVGAKKAAQEIFPNIPAAKLEQVVGAGVITLFGTQDLTLTVLSVAQEYFAIYPSLDAEEHAPPIATTIGVPTRPQKKYSATCLKLWKFSHPDGHADVWAGFNKTPVLTDSNGNKMVWPAVDLLAGDIVEMTAELDPLAEEPYTVKSSGGTFTGTSRNTPGIGTDQVTLLIKFSTTV